MYYLSKYKNINLDKKISKMIVYNFKFILKDIHPNIITTIGIFSNIMIYYIQIGTCIKYLFFIKYLSDVLDGEVARTFDKSTKLGNFLDTTSDLMYIGIALQHILSINTIYFIVPYFIFIYNVNNRYKLYETHDYIKDSDKNNFFIDEIVRFLTLNSYLMYIFFFLFW